MEKLLQHVRECRSFALASDNAITETLTVRKTLIVLEKTGVFANTARDWRKLPPLEQTWVELFKIANDERKRLLTSEGAGYHSANAAQTSTAAQLEQALAALATMTAAANAATDTTPARPHQSAPISNAG